MWSLTRAFMCPVYALPVDVFRILVGGITFLYFLRTWTEIDDFSSPDGLLDHALLQRIFWASRMGLFQAGMSEALIRFTYLLALGASLLLVLGVRPRLAAAALYLVAVSTYRWNFPVSYVEDGVMHLLLFWSILLPVGTTLTLSDWLAGGRRVPENWIRRTVPGAAVRLFLINLAMVYVVAGLWKWTSPMWRQGTALYVILQLSVSRAPTFWEPRHLPALAAVNHAVLLTEPLLALLVLWPVRPVKWLLVPVLLAFHLGIVATMDIPLANLGMAGALVLILRHDLMRLLCRSGPPPLPAPVPPARRADRLGAFVVACLALQMVADIQNPPWRTPTAEAGGPPEEFASERVVADVLSVNPFHLPLWMVGISQSYRLFDWIDDRNFVFRYTLIERRGGSAVLGDPRDLFPSSPRSTLLQANLHGVTWAKIPRSRRGELKESILRRAARRYCLRRGPVGPVDVFATVERVVVPEHSAPSVRTSRLLRFTCRPDQVEISSMAP
ncbi:MAG: hypothetical protein QN141_10565 [Armatimonadota bacterium]|nr:hypothetical protein [Armatimonadota bacterium]MDR7451510.1 hypothetical protein [Armatimonadota bacterium]MDR7467477.1 hypothetical protein [Armatimonadota bacterium]MDR7494351.1 hypothetical protein [Armatimonadota bacterium]MDR7499168.1 hypothetical protein [Armatimonadota bacterium]